MQLFPEIIPLFEAYVYLSERFSPSRASDRMKIYEANKDKISTDRWTYFSRIIDIQNELDTLIPADPIMERYFTPLKTKDDLPGEKFITLGGLLLHIPPALEYPFSYDGLTEYYASAPQQDILDNFYGGTLAPFYNDNAELETVNMSKIVSTVNSILVDTEDKWALIDCVTDPCAHLEKLRPLVTEVMAIIVDRCKAFSDFIAYEMGQFCAKDSFVRNMNAVARIDLKPKQLADTKVFTSLFRFNGFDMSYKQESFEFNRMIIGIYMNTLLELRQKDISSEEHVQLLKLLSDQTRFNVLHELCDRESYGQELADRFGGARSAIYYHLEKLLGYGLLDVKMTEYRMLYTMNKQSVFDKLTAMRDFLLNGWKPGE